MRIRDLGDSGAEAAGEQKAAAAEEKVEARGTGKFSRLNLKRAPVGISGRVLFYPTLLCNVVRNRIEPDFHWWDRIGESILLGALPFSKHVPRLKQLGVVGVVTLNEPYETLVPTSLYQAHGINHLVIPTRDYLFAPSLEDIYRAIDFIHGNTSRGGTNYVHCKAGRGRSTTIVLCYLIKHRSMGPEEALEYVRSIRPRVKLATSQRNIRMLPFLLHFYPKGNLSLLIFNSIGSKTFHV